MANDLLIKINADAKNAQKAFDDIQKQSEDLTDALSKTAVVAGAAFAAFTAEIFFSVRAFEEAQKASAQLTNALQNQGIYTEELITQYGQFADAVSEKTGVDDDAITTAQAVAQTYLGQTKITEELTAAIADLAALQGGDLNSAAEKIAKTIGTGTNAFARQGLVISETATEAEKMARVLEFVQAKAGGLAAEFNKADGFTKALGTSFENFQEAIGARFAPAVASVRENLVGFFNALSKSDLLIDLTAGFIAAGAAVSGLVLFGSVVTPALAAATAAAAALGVSLSVAFVGIPLVIGAVVAAIVFFARNWTETIAVVKAAVSAFGVFLVETFEGIASVIYGALTLNPDRINAGLSQITKGIQLSKDSAIAIYKEETKEIEQEKKIQDENRKAQADKEAAEKARQQANIAAINKAGLELMKLQNDNASKELIDLKTKEIEVLKALGQEKTNAEIKLLLERKEAINALQQQQAIEDAQREAEFFKIQQEAKTQLQQDGIVVEAEIRAARLAQIQSELQTEADVERQIQEEILQNRIKVQNQALLDRKKYGETYAVLNKAINSDEVQGVKSASQELIQLQQSKNSSLKAIGKAAAVANITVATSESAMNIYRGFSTIPIIGPALGVAGAAAAVAFGAERIGQVVGAVDGGLITGGISGRDSVPALLAPGELVVPERNFDQVVGAVRGNGGTNDPEILNVLNEINSKFSNPQTTIIQGDVMNDDSFIDTLVRKISDAVQYRNAEIFGVTT